MSYGGGYQQYGGNPYGQAEEGRANPYGGATGGYGASNPYGGTVSLIFIAFYPGARSIDHYVRGVEEKVIATMRAAHCATCFGQGKKQQDLFLGNRRRSVSNLILTDQTEQSAAEPPACSTSWRFDVLARLSILDT